MTSRRALKVAAGILMVGGLGLVTAPLAASAHTGKLFTWSNPSFVDISQTNASLTPLAVVEPNVTGADICDELSWAVSDESQGTNDSYVLPWNHDTGTTGTPVLLTADIADFDGAVDVDVADAYAADSLPGADCRKIAYVRYLVDDGENETTPLFVSYVDLTTGLTRPIIELPELSDGSFISWNGIATDPVTNNTYLFARFQGSPYLSYLDIAAGEQSELLFMEGLFDYFYESGGDIREADFQPDGKLWMLYGSDQAETWFLVSFPPNSDLEVTEPTEIGEPNAGDPPIQYSGATVLTYDPAALPATGGAPLGLIVVGGALLAAGAVVAAFGSRSVRPKS